MKSVPSKIKTYLVILVVVNSGIALSQVETVPADHPVYSFLKQMQVKGILKNYNDVILPLSKQQVIDDLKQIDDKSDKLNQIDKEFLERMEEKLGMNSKLDKSALNVFDNFPQKLWPNITADSEKHLYNYKDSTISFFIDPILEGKYIYSSSYKNNSSLLSIGGTIRGSYDNWFGFYLQGTDGSVTGSRDVAEIDKRVEQSYTFNQTKINFFDETKGYLRLQKGIVDLQMGRERVLWGNGYINRTILSDNPQMFDFIRFDIAYKKFSYNFLHGWLVQKPIVQHIDSLIGDVKFKSSKYVAISRLGYQANNSLSFGITQMIIYSDRPFELAYLNPFLFWESAQRSLNDLDNSFLAFDGRYLITNGLEVSSSIIFDDINFSYLFQGEWARSNNGEEWQAGAMITSPLIPDDMVIKLEYMQARPYIFSHPGIGEALTYTNNGYLLGSDLQPNSTRFSTDISYRISARSLINISYSHTLHGNNIYDANGNLIENFGGSEFNNFSFYASDYAYLLDGIRELYDDLNLNIQYEFAYGYYLNLNYEYRRSKIFGKEVHENIFWTSFDVNFE
ncbi:MAG: hypothetical protein M1480_19020 [Bacteroidetes bacterium]|nr:hypothetical protein [Bacteroidota bacterium]